MAFYTIIACNVLWRELCYFTSLSTHTFKFIFLEQGLHNEPDTLRNRVQQAIDEADDECDAILIGYGLCSNGLVGIKSRANKLVVMRGHDCITFLLGSKEKYREYFDAHPGTYWYSPGWIETGTQPGKERYDTTFQSYVEKYGEDNADYLMKMEQNWIDEYSNAAYVDLGFMRASEWKDYTKACAKWLGWRYDELQGDPGLMSRFVSGEWNAREFLVVEPGSEIIASHDEEIIDAAKEGRDKE